MNGWQGRRCTGEALLRWCDRAGRDQYDATRARPIEWNRLGIFKNITIRLIAQIFTAITRRHTGCRRKSERRAY